MRSVRKLWRYWAAGVVALWVGAFLLSPDAPSAPTLARPAERWELPAHPERRDVTPAAVLMATASLWGKPAAASATQAPPADERWLISATFIPGGGPPRLVVRFAAGDKRPQTLSIGDNLPDGSKIESIQSSTVCVTRERKRQCLPVPAKTRREF